MKDTLQMLTNTSLILTGSGTSLNGKKKEHALDRKGLITKVLL